MSASMLVVPQIGRYVSKAYEKMGLHDILNEDIQPEELFESERVIRLLREAQERSLTKKRVYNMSTLAFHLLTMVEGDPR
jgi:hypothetical protein